MFRFAHSSKMQSASRRGFSLVELAIVVGVTGLLFGGLWRLMSSGNSQLREQTAADQMNQVVSATRNFLASQQGQTILTGLAGNGMQRIFLPLAQANAAGQAGCAGDLIAQLAGSDTFCNFLPTGFWNGTTNSYGQTYLIVARKDNNGTGIPAQNYDFLVMTTGGDVIPDSSGGRVAANIGSNGGFLFSNNTCGAAVATTACGAFGSFNLDLSAAGPYNTTAIVAASSASGHIVTQNSSTLSAAANANWLARVTIPGDTGTPPIFNTMRVPLNMLTGGGAALNMFGNTLNLGDGAAATGGGTVNMQSGTIVGQGSINISNDIANTIPLTVRNSSTGAAATNAAWVRGQTGCSIIGAAPGTCTAALLVSGSILVSDSLSVSGDGLFNQLNAVTFIYTSDMRAKKNILPLENSLERISQLKGYHFNWRQDDRADIGLIAQDVQKVYPELVHARADGKLGVEYGNLIAPMIEAIKELRAENKTLRDKIEAQETRLKKIEVK